MYFSKTVKMWSYICFVLLLLVCSTFQTKHMDDRPSAAGVSGEITTQQLGPEETLWLDSMNSTSGANGTEWVKQDFSTDSDVNDAEKLFSFVVNGVMLNGIGAGGLVGNALSMLVLSRPQMRSSFNHLLIGLVTCDTALILSSMLLFGLTDIYPYTGYLRYYYFHVYPQLTPFLYPLANMAQTMSVYLTLIVTVERWVAVCHPFRAKALFTSCSARWYMLGTALFAFAYNLPKFFELEAYALTRNNGADNASDVIYIVTLSDFRSETYVTVYIHWMYLIVMYIVPLSTLAVLNACIVRQVRRAQAERAQLSHAQCRELGLATMLLVIVLVFFLCNLLPLVLHTLEAYMHKELEDMEHLLETSNLLQTINSSVNFIIYVAYGEKFKHVCIQIIKEKVFSKCSAPSIKSDHNLSTVSNLST